MEDEIRKKIHEKKQELEANLRKLPVNQDTAMKAQEKELVHFYNGKIDELYKGFEEEYLAKTKKWVKEGRNCAGQESNHREANGLDQRHLPKNRKGEQKLDGFQTRAYSEKCRHQKVKCRIAKVFLSASS